MAKTEIESVDRLVSKKNQMIEGMYVLSSSAQDVMAALISEVNPKDPTTFDREISLSAKQLADLTGVSPSFMYRKVQDICQELLSIPVVVYDIAEDGGFVSNDKGERSFSVVNFFYRSHWDTQKKVGTFKWHPELKPYLVNFFQGNYTKYYLPEFRQIKGKYAKRIYEIIRQRHTIAKPALAKTKITYTLEKFEKMIGIRDSNGKYKVKKYEKGGFRALNQALIKPALIDINDKTNMQLQVEPLYTGRFVTSLQFTATTIHEAIDENDEIHQLLVKYGISPEKLEPVIDVFGRDLIFHTANVVEGTDAVSTLRDKKTYFAKLLTDQAITKYKKKKGADANSKQKISEKISDINNFDW